MGHLHPWLVFISPVLSILLTHDIGTNVTHDMEQRLEELYQMDPSIYANLADMVKKEVEEKSAKKALSCTRALLWLTRYAMLLLYQLY